MFQLPQDILREIYSYDNTYKTKLIDALNNDLDKKSIEIKHFNKMKVDINNFIKHCLFNSFCKYYGYYEFKNIDHTLKINKLMKYNNKDIYHVYFATPYIERFNMPFILSFKMYIEVKKYKNYDELENDNKKFNKEKSKKINHEKYHYFIDINQHNSKGQWMTSRIFLCQMYI